MDASARTIGLVAHLPPPPAGAQPDTTAIVLNWSRLPNVQRIAATLCAPTLAGIVAQVFIWNNSPQELTHDDFPDCPRDKIRIHNSPANLYFQARFLACREVSTPYCFIQDDDFLVTPEALHTLHAALTHARDPHAIHLLPAHEHLSSSLREIHVAPAPGADPAARAIHTGFAWLGHGALLPRSDALAFLDLLHVLRADDDEAKMADNYYAILANRVPDVWFDQGVPLGGGVPFTVGTEGDARNERHIVRAADYLTAAAAGAYGPAPPYVSRAAAAPADAPSVAHAACRGTRCLLSTNIALFPADARPVHSAPTVREFLALEARSRAALGADALERYVAHAPSCAVDGRLETYFVGACDARAGDFVSLDFFDDVRALGASSTAELVWVVDAGTEDILRTCVLECSADGATWNVWKYALACREIFAEEPQHAQPNAAYQAGTLCECIFTISVDAHAAAAATDAPMSTGGVRAVRVRNMRDRASPWKIHQVSVRRPF